MAHAYDLTACWAARARSVEEYALDLANLHNELAALDYRFVPWFTSLDDPSIEIALPEELAAYLLRHPETWRHGKSEYHAWEAAFSNGQRKGASVELSIKCGIDQPSTTVWFPNQFTLSLYGPARLDSFSNVDTVLRLIESVVGTFDPRWVAFGPRESAEQSLEDVYSGLPPPAWTLYVQTERPELVTALQAPFIAVPLARGILVRTPKDWPDPTLQRDADSMRALTQLLVGAGIVAPAVELVPD